jgi:DNA-binding response OmpR family regulator
MEVLDTDDPARVRRAAEEKYDLFLIAMTEDERGGAALCRVLRQTGCQRPLVVVSSRRPSPAERRGLDESKAGLLVSPFGPGELVHRVRQAIAEESWSDEA